MVPTSVGPAATEEIDDLREHDREVLEFLATAPSSFVGFQGLRRRLRIHPEQLSRALQRLAREDLITRTDLGYRVSSKALSLLSPESLSTDTIDAPILQAYLPGDVDVRALVRDLKGSWIGPLRWYGLAETAAGVRLSWATEDDNLQLDVAIEAGQLTIRANVTSPARLDEAARLGHQLFQHVSRQSSHGSYPSLSG